MRSKVFKVVMCMALVLVIGGVAFAQDHGATGVKDKSALAMIGFACALGLGLAAGLAAFSQSRAIAAALESVARQPEAGGRLQTMMLIGVVFIETLVIFTWVLFFLWGGKFLP